MTAKTNTAPTKTSKPEFSWEDVSEATYDVYERATGTGTTRVDVETEIAKPIRDMIEKSYAEYFQELTVNGQKLPEKSNKWRKIDLGTVERANEFKRLAQRYGKYRKDGQITVRAVLVKDPGTKNDTSAVRFVAKPLEKREPKRVPGTEKKTVAAK